MAKPVISRIPFAPLSALISMLARNGGVDLRRLHHLLGMVLRYGLLEPFRIAERVVFDRAIEAHTLERDPIFILGHWRSGTSYLQTLLSQDTALTTSTVYRSIFADNFCITEPWLKPVLNVIARILRLPFSLQRLPLELDIRAEGDVALCSMLSPYSYTWGHLFPARFEHWLDHCVLRPGPEVAAGWIAHYDAFIRKLSMASGGRQVVMKSPGDTARLDLLLRQYPNARFVYIHRDPVAVFHSNRYLWDVIRREFSLQNINDSDVDARILRTYQALLGSYLLQRDKIPASQLAEIRYEALRADPLSELRWVYHRLGLGEPPSGLTSFLSFQKRYPTPTYKTPPELEARLRDVWSFSFAEWPEPVTSRSPSSSSRKGRASTTQTTTATTPCTTPTTPAPNTTQRSNRTAKQPSASSANTAVRRVKN